MLWRRANRSRLQPDQIKDSNAIATTGSGSWPKARVPFCWDGSGPQQRPARARKHPGGIAFVDQSEHDWRREDQRHS
jgi:hypothetical protein